MARRKILVTGATDGIGLALVRRLADRHDVIATGRREPGHVAALLPQDVIYLKADQADPEEAAHATVRGLLENNQSRLDYVVLNAGINRAVAPQAETAEEIRRVIDINVAGTIAMAQVLFPFLKRASGQITFVGSVMARRGSSRFASYAASKAALHGLARALGEEWRDEVRVQMLHPGPTMTPLHEKAGFKPGWARHFYVPPEAMAAMFEDAIHRGRPLQRLTWWTYLRGAALFGKAIR